MATLVKCGRKYINLDHVDMIEPSGYYQSMKIRILFTNSENYTSILISDEEFKEFEASLAKYTN